MTLISLEFIVFFVLVLLIYYILPGRFQWIWLFISSLLFYSTISETKQLIFFLCIILLNWFFTLFMGEEKEYRKRAYIAVLLINIMSLAILKYIDFFYQVYLSAGTLFGQDLHSDVIEKTIESVTSIAPPRISYFLLILIGYITDVYWGKVQVQKNPCKVMLFAGYFPQMTSGPIVQYEQMEKELWGEKHHFQYERFIFGAERILWGMFKKLVISERCAVIVNEIYAYYEAYAGFYIVIAAALFALQLYTDFSGLMDIVLGFSEILGITLPENFQTPFYSLDLSEFWRRWHITLGGFLRDYVLYPIQRSNLFRNFRKFCKKTFGKNYVKYCDLPLFLSLLISWFLIGLWHGGGFNYIFGVGIYMWMVIVAGSILKPVRSLIVKLLHINTDCFSYRLFLRIRTFFFFIFGLSFFRAETLRDGFAMWKSAFSLFNPWIFFDQSLYKLGLSRQEIQIGLCALLALVVVSHLQQKGSVRQMLMKQNFVFRLLIFAVLLCVVITFGYYGTGYDAANFIYGRF